MLSQVLPVPKKLAAAPACATTSLWQRVVAACNRSFELLAESKSRFPMDM